MPAGSGDVDVMLGPLMVIEKVLDAVCGLGVVESTTVTATLLVTPGAVGVPLITPVVEFNVAG